MDKNNIKQLKKLDAQLVIIIALLVILGLGTTYAYLNISATNSSASGQAGCFSVNYTSGQNINTSSLATTTDYLEGASTTLSLSKASGCNIYTEATLHLKTNATLTTAPISTVQAFKYKIVATSNSIVKSDETLTSSVEGTITSTSDITLATVKLGTTSVSYTVYLWIDSDISEGEYDAKTYSGYIYAESIQTSTKKS